MRAGPARLLAAEAIGTGFLVLFGAGSVVAALSANAGVLAYPGLGFVALTFGLAIAIAIYAFGTTSGAHLNPAVSDRAHIARAVNATVVTLDEAPDGYRDFDRGAAKKFVLDPHGTIAA